MLINSTLMRNFVTTCLFCFLSLGYLALANAEVSDSSLVVDLDEAPEVISTEFELADGPSWDGSRLVIPDVKGQKLFSYNPKTKQVQTLVEQAGRISASFYNHGRLFLSDNGMGQLAFLDSRQKRTIQNLDALRQDEGQKPYRPNDLVVDRDGGVYLTFTPQGQVIYVAANGKSFIAIDELATPNGITMSPDGSTLYVSSFVPKKIWAYDIASPGKVENGRMIATMDEGPDRGADGMTVDRAGNIYCAGPTDIWIWSPSGKLIEKIACPTKPINCTFGDQDMRSLYISALGGLYRKRMRISGVAPSPVSLALQPVSEHSGARNDSIPSTKIPPGIKTQFDVVYASYGERKLLADIFTPTSADSTNTLPGLIVVHGGGWHNGDKTKFRALSTKLAGRGYVVAAIEYRLADEAAFPAAIHDCNAAVRYLRTHAKRLHLDADRIGAVGGSAGGHLVGLLAAGNQDPRLHGSGGNPNQSSRIQAAIVMAGPMEMLTGSVAQKSRSGEGFSNANSWLRGTVDEKPELYRLADAYDHINRDTCPILFMVGEHDQPSRNQPSRDKLKSFGIETGVKIYPDGKHGCWNRLPWINDMVVDMDQFLRTNMK